MRRIKLPSGRIVDLDAIVDAEPFRPKPDDTDGPFVWVKFRYGGAEGYLRDDGVAVYAALEATLSPAIDHSNPAAFQPTIARPECLHGHHARTVQVEATRAHRRCLDCGDVMDIEKECSPTLPGVVDEIILSVTATERDAIVDACNIAREWDCEAVSSETISRICREWLEAQGKSGVKPPAWTTAVPKAKGLYLWRRCGEPATEVRSAHVGPNGLFRDLGNDIEYFGPIPD